MRTAIRLLIPVIAAIGLAGCFTAEQEVITDDIATAPYERITFLADSEKDDEPNLALRVGKTYVVQGQDSEVTMKFADMGDGLYIVETFGKDEEDEIRLFGGLKLDAAAGTAAVYKVMANLETDTGPGLTACGEDAICIEDLEAYAALVRKAIADGADPTGTYKVTLD